MDFKEGGLFFKSQLAIVLFRMNIFVRGGRLGLSG